MYTKMVAQINLSTDKSKIELEAALEYRMLNKSQQKAANQ